MEKLIRVYCVLYYSDSGPGAAGDGTFTRRFRNKKDAEAFAEGKTLWGHAATVQADDVPRRLAQRWGIA